MPDTDPPNSQPSTAAKTWMHVAADIVALLILGALMVLDKLDVMYGVPLVLLIIGAKLPTRGGGVVTLLAPFIEMLGRTPKL